MSTLNAAIALAAHAHAGVLDKGGHPYILHPLRVMLAQKSDAARMVAVLHDVVEDTPVTLAQLREMGFSEDVVSGVDAVTRRDGESYAEFIDRACVHPLGRVVKHADLTDNADLSRLPEPNANDVERCARYRRFIAQIEALPPL